MQTELEVKILDIDISEIKEVLVKVGAQEKGSFNQKRYVYDIESGDESRWIRLRQKGDTSTLTYKQISDDNISGTKEVEVEVSNFEATNTFLELIGFKAKSYQENRRNSFTLSGVEIEIDEWPMVNPYLEIEGKTEAEVYATVEKLGFTKDDCTSINTMEIYKQNGIDLNSIKELRF